MISTLHNLSVGFKEHKKSMLLKASEHIKFHHFAQAFKVAWVYVCVCTVLLNKQIIVKVNFGVVSHCQTHAESDSLPRLLPHHATVVRAAEAPSCGRMVLCWLQDRNLR